MRRLVLIIYDSREKNWKGIEMLKQEVDEVKEEILDAGDFCIPTDNGKILVERNTFLDLASKLKSGRVWDQIDKMKNFTDDVYMIIENPYGFKYTKWNIHSITGLLTSVSNQVKVLVSVDWRWSVGYLVYLERKFSSKKIQTDIHVRFGKKGVDLQTEARYVLEGFRGIGGNRSHNLLLECKTLRNALDGIMKGDAKVRKIIGEHTYRQIEEILDAFYGLSEG